MSRKHTWPMSYREWAEGRGGAFASKLSTLRDRFDFRVPRANFMEATGPNGWEASYDFTDRWEGTSPINVGARHVAEQYLVYRFVAERNGAEPSEFEDFYHDDDDPEA